MMSARTFSIFINKVRSTRSRKNRRILPDGQRDWGAVCIHARRVRGWPRDQWVILKCPLVSPIATASLTTVYLPNGPISTPLRLVPNGFGCELMLTLFRKADRSDEAYARDMKMVMNDLNRFKRLMESDGDAVVHVDFQQKRR